MVHPVGRVVYSYEDRYKHVGILFWEIDPTTLVIKIQL